MRQVQEAASQRTFNGSRSEFPRVAACINSRERCRERESVGLPTGRPVLAGQQSEIRIPAPSTCSVRILDSTLFLKKRCPAGTGSDPRPPRRLLSVHARHNTGRGRLLSAAILLNWRRTRARGRRTRSAGSIRSRR